MKVYVLKIWGNLRSIHSSYEAANKSGQRIAEPTSTDGKFNYCAYTIELWEEGVGRIDYWQEEWRVKREIDE